MFPIPETSRWVCSASPSGSAGSAPRRRASIASTSGSAASTSGPSRRATSSSTRSTGPFELQRLHALAAEHEPRPPEHGLLDRLHVPAPVHPQVAPDDEPALEPEQEVLPDRLDRLEPTSRAEALRDARHLGLRMRRLDLDDLSHERLEPTRRAMERIALGHAASVACVMLLSRMSAPDTARGLNIAALARRTGVAPDTLRKWEQRYGVLRPSRTAGGQRRYDESDVARVEWLRARLAEGWRIGEAAALLGEGDAPGSPAELRGAILEAVADADGERIGRLLDHAFALLELEETLVEVVHPVLRGRRARLGRRAALRRAGAPRHGGRSARGSSACSPTRAAASAGSPCSRARRASGTSSGC